MLEWIMSEAGTDATHWISIFKDPENQNKWIAYDDAMDGCDAQVILAKAKRIKAIQILEWYEDETLYDAD